MNDRKCPHCESSVYREFLDDGRAKICCMSKACNWESLPEGRHSFIDINTLQETKNIWR